MRFLLPTLLFLLFSCSEGIPENMVLIEGGEFEFGAESHLEKEGPSVEVEISSFYLDKNEVTNAEFSEFVKATSYKTTAESSEYGGSLVFDGSEWSFVEGANWQHPFGPGSDIDTMMDHPVVHVSWEDAEAYCNWKSKRLPTETEWEFAATQGLRETTYDNCNHWQGEFPLENENTDGWLFSARVGSFPENALGIYDLHGNVWEWCSDSYIHDIHETYGTYKDLLNPNTEGESYDPQRPGDKDLRVLKGGSFLCSDSYCSGYRKEARISAKKSESYSHIGFRCACD